MPVVFIFIICWNYLYFYEKKLVRATKSNRIGELNAQKLVSAVLFRGKSGWSVGR